MDVKGKRALTISHIKILLTVLELNDSKLYPTPKGVGNILSGHFDNETNKYTHIKTYATLISFQGRKLNAYINYLIKNKYLEEIYDPKTDALYLKITNKGEAESLLYLRTRKEDFPKKVIKEKQEIVEIK